ncbi:hypothetical protein [Elizabethkingia anophelis]|uniref:hypothetical protein n=1 Tax=Elizabethkingia anophelis TaxID=1117645 RepID=UPI003891F903
MEGNYRIVEISEGVYVIEKEKVTISTKGILFWKKTIKESIWMDCDIHGNFTTHDRVLYIDLNEARQAVQYIRKFPIVVE